MRMGAARRPEDRAPHRGHGPPALDGALQGRVRRGGTRQPPISLPCYWEGRSPLRETSPLPMRARGVQARTFGRIGGCTPPCAWFLLPLSAAPQLLRALEVFPPHCHDPAYRDRLAPPPP